MSSISGKGREDCPLKLITHYPTSVAGKEELKKRVAEVHGAAVKAKVMSLPVTNTDKKRYLKAISEDYV